MTPSAPTPGTTTLGDLGHGAGTRGDDGIDRSVGDRFAVADVHGDLRSGPGARSCPRHVGNSRRDQVGCQGQRDRPCHRKAKAHANHLGPVTPAVVDEAYPIDPAQSGAARGVPRGHRCTLGSGGAQHHPKKLGHTNPSVKAGLASSRGRPSRRQRLLPQRVAGVGVGSGPATARRSPGVERVPSVQMWIADHDLARERCRPGSGRLPAGVGAEQVVTGLAAVFHHGSVSISRIGYRSGCVPAIVRRRGEAVEKRRGRAGQPGDVLAGREVGNCFSHLRLDTVPILAEGAPGRTHLARELRQPRVRIDA